MYAEARSRCTHPASLQSPLHHIPDIWIVTVAVGVGDLRESSLNIDMLRLGPDMRMSPSSPPHYTLIIHIQILLISALKKLAYSAHCCISPTKFRFWILTSSVFVLQFRLLIDANELYTNFGNTTFRGMGMKSDCKMIASVLTNLYQPVNRVAINHSGYFNIRRNWNHEWYLAKIIVCVKTFQVSVFPISRPLFWWPMAMSHAVIFNIEGVAAEKFP